MQAPGEHLLIQALDGVLWLDSELIAERLPEELVLAKCTIALSGRSVETDEAGVRLFLDRVDGDDLLESSDRRASLATLLAKSSEGGQQRDAEAAQFLAPPDGPILEAIFREQVAGVQIESRRVRCRIVATARRLRRPLERLDVDPQRSGRLERQDLVLEHQRRSTSDSRGRWRESATSDVERLVQVVGGGFWLKLRPQLLDDLLAVQTVARRQCEQLYEASGLAAPPLGMLDRAYTNRYVKAAEKLYPHAARSTVVNCLRSHVSLTNFSP
jgi:hypothetical protein